jgi:hypothetical protein
MKTIMHDGIDTIDNSIETFNPLLTTAQVSRLLQVSESYLEKRRLAGSGPRFCRIGDRPIIRYAMSDIVDFVERSRGRGLVQ